MWTHWHKWWWREGKTENWKSVTLQLYSIIIKKANKQKQNQQVKFPFTWILSIPIWNALEYKTFAKRLSKWQIRFVNKIFKVLVLYSNGAIGGIIIKSCFFQWLNIVQQPANCVSITVINHLDWNFLSSNQLIYSLQQVLGILAYPLNFPLQSRVLRF